MVYEYKDLKGVIKVGDRVRAVKGKLNPCDELLDDGSNERKITSVSKVGFDINHCYHPYAEGYYLDLNPNKTLDDLQVGDEVVSVIGDKRRVLARLEQCVLLSIWSRRDYWETSAGNWFHIEELKRGGYTLSQPVPTPTKVELTVGELEEKLQMQAGTLRIKKD